MRKQYFNHEAGPLPLKNRFIRITLGETQWIIPARHVLAAATAYYEREGWYEECELEEDKELKQPRGRKLRGVVEVNTDLDHHAKEERWSKFEAVAKLIAGPEVIPPDDDPIWWFEEQHGTVEEVTDLPLAKQLPKPLYWFSDKYAEAHGIEVS